MSAASPNIQLYCGIDALRADALAHLPLAWQQLQWLGRHANSTNTDNTP